MENKDRYDEEIEELMALDGAGFRRAVSRHWIEAFPLFTYISRDCGCLTQVRGGEDGPLGRDDLTAEIRSDKRIPSDPVKITKRSLPVFAEWQRRLDQEPGLDR